MPSLDVVLAEIRSVAVEEEFVCPVVVGQADRDLVDEAHDGLLPMTGLDGLMIQLTPSLDVANPIWVLPDP